MVFLSTMMLMSIQREVTTEKEQRRFKNRIAGRNTSIRDEEEILRKKTAETWNYEVPPEENKDKHLLRLGIPK